MKRLFLILLFFCSIEVYGDTKKVAILETVDKEGNVSYALKLMVRSSLSTAIAETPGYEAYDRVDIASILGEHEFQRTGLIKDDDIKRLGEMTGAAYILVAEVAYLNETTIIILSKFLNIETAKIESSSKVYSSTSIEDLDKNCKILARKLLKLDIEEAKAAEEARIKAEREAKIKAEQEARKREERLAEQRRMEIAKYVDLGLPSGTLWKKTNESGLYDYDTAVSRYGSKLPTVEQFNELKSMCRWTWNGRGYSVIGPNGNSIFLPADGERLSSRSMYKEGAHGYYWSSMSSSLKAWALWFDKRGAYVSLRYRDRGRSVRLVYNP